MRILLDKPILLLGRDSECDIQFESRKISRRHCCIAQVGDRLVIRDLDSTNGIRINGVRTIEGYLKTGDQLAIGNHRYRVSWDDEPPPRPRERRDARKELAPPDAVEGVDDDVLEACDEPIPLTDPAPNLKLPVKDLPSKTARPGDDDSLTGRSAPPILPEHLDLAPASDSFPPSPPVP
jgi:pSer/pThr/pTyr-binding forkhead associated (FHA) protein